MCEEPSPISIWATNQTKQKLFSPIKDTGQTRAAFFLIQNNAALPSHPLPTQARSIYRVSPEL